MDISYYKKIKDFIHKYRILINILAPTYMIYSYLKNKMTTREDKYLLANDIKKFFLALSIYILSTLSMIDLIYENKQTDKLFMGIFFIMGIISSIILIINFSDNYSEEKINKKISVIKNTVLTIFIIIPLWILICILFSIPIDYKYIVENYIFTSYTYLIVIYILAISRPLHFIMVFIPDIFRKIEKPEQRSGVEKVRLLLIAIGSYVNIITDYSILYYFINKASKNFNEVGNIIDILYKVVGYGELDPLSMVAKILIIMQMASITILITGNLAMYISIDTKKNS